MDIMTLAMCKPIVIDYDEFGISDTILSLFAQGGGEADLTGLDLREMWKKLDYSNGMKPVVVHFTLAPMNLQFYQPATWIRSAEVRDAVYIISECTVRSGTDYLRAILEVGRDGWGATVRITVTTP